MKVRTEGMSPMGCIGEGVCAGPSVLPGRPSESESLLAR